MASRLLFLLSRLTRHRRRRQLMTLLLLLLLLLILILLLPLPYLIYKPPALLIRILQHFSPEVLWRVDLPKNPTTNTPRKIIALTIDDAPSRYTEEILSVLKANDATATFFVIGSQVSGLENRLKLLVREGCELGNHAWRDEPSLSLESGMLTDQIHAVERLIADAYAGYPERGHPPRFFRPGSGVFNGRMRRLLSGLGYTLVLGDVYPHDAQVSWSSVNARHVLSMVRPGSIVICHDRRSWTVGMLRVVLPEMKRRGYEVVTVSELLRVKREEEEKAKGGGRG